MERHYATLTETRSHLPEILDAAEAGIPAWFERRGVGFVVAPKEFYTSVLSGSVPRPEVYPGGGSWTFILPGTPIATEAVLFDEALEDFIDALKEYAEDWLVNEVLRNAPSHRDNRGLVQLVTLLTEEELREWVGGGAPAHSGSSPHI